MINKLHLAMIELYSGDARRIQHFCKVHSYAKIIAETGITVTIPTGVYRESFYC